MQSCPPRPAAKRPGGFTLIELLVVIAIIGVLAAILSSVMGKVQNSARKVGVVNDMRNLRIATNSYFQDYHHLPITPVQQMAVENQGYDTVYGDPNGLYKNRDLIDVLRAVSAGSRYNQNNELNPTKTVYWEGQPAKSPTRPVNGITAADYTTDQGELIEKGSFIDSWGHPYVMWVDANRDDDLSMAAGWFYHDVKPGDVPVRGEHLGMEFGSLGPDGLFGAKGNGTLAGSDDTVSWQN